MSASTPTAWHRTPVLRTVRSRTALAPARLWSGEVLAAIEPDVKGYFRGRKPDQVGPDASVAADLLFENVQVPSDNIIGELDYRFFHLLHTRNRSGSSARSATSPAQRRSSTRPWCKARTTKLLVIRSVSFSTMGCPSPISLLDRSRPSSHRSVRDCPRGG
ncbi:acyl-CoA dehydrogenase [Rhodococcus jostii RHA1]|uniref:Acyl-CoA dehydrogenase n=1 Tax=Rhodococcus jostii (strain RHA1) TaxID=101510 RepID=Q0S1W6_RHOJR|nr:acyl-CoA dehydrogenase [Rhodococcus jostii RHA1]